MQAIFRNHKARIVWTAIIIVFCSLVNVYAGYSLSLILDVIGKGTRELIIICFRVSLAWIASIGLIYISGRVKAKTSMILTNDLRRNISTYVKSMDYETFIKFETGTVISWYNNDIALLKQKLIYGFFDLLEAASTICFSFYVLVRFQYIIGIAALIFSVLLFFLSKVFSVKLDNATQTYSSRSEVFLARITDLVKGFTVYYSNNKLFEFSRKTSLVSEDFGKDTLDYENNLITVKSSMGLANTVFQIGLLLLTSILATLGLAPIGAVVSITNLGGSFLNSIISFLNTALEMKSGSAIIDKFQVESNSMGKTEPDCKPINTIALEQVSIGYDGTAVIKNLSQEFHIGQKYLVKGASGTGKSTLMKGLVGLKKLMKGTISVDGKEVVHNSEPYRNIFGYVEQDPYMFFESIAYNIALTADYDENHIMQCLRAVNMDVYVNSLPESIETIVGGQDAKLSTGQKQRLAIARILYQDKDIIVVDEGTANLDEANHIAIEKFLLNMKNTVIVVSHNFMDENMNLVDKVISLD